MVARPSRHSVAAGVIGIAAVAGLVLVPSNAAAATTTSCTSGYSPWTLTSVNFFFPSSDCPSFADSGAPYVFDIGTLNVAQRPPLDPSKPLYTQFANAVASCTGYTRSANNLAAQNCTITL